MNKVYVLFLCCFLLFCCNRGEVLEKNKDNTLKHLKQNKSIEENYKTLLGTKWISPLTSTCGEIVFDSLIFKPDCTSAFYDCEFGEKSLGKFHLKEDTVIIKSDISFYPDHKTYKHVFKLLLFTDTLIPIYAKFGHLDPKTEFDSTYIFYKDTNSVSKH